MKLKTAVIGVGYLGRFHAQKHAQNPAVELVGVCDGRLEQAEAVAHELKTSAFKDPRDLLGKVDAVTIAASTQAHYELGKMFLSEGIPTNLEKPLAATLQQAQELVEMAARKKALLCTGHIERFNPSLVALKKEIQRAQSLQLVRHTGFRARGADVSVLHDLMIHDVDLILWLTGSHVKDFKASGVKLVQPTWDAAEVHFDLANGTQAHISVSRVSQQPLRQVRALESGRVITVDSGNLKMEIVSARPERGEDPLQVETRQVEKVDALQMETDAFIAAVLGKAPPAVTGEDGLKALELVTQIDLALQGRPA